MRLVCLGLILLASATLNAAEPAPRPTVLPGEPEAWPAFRNDLQLNGVAATTLPENLELLWEVELGDQVVATAAIAGGKVFVPCLSGELVCLDRATGKREWAYKSVEKVEPNSFPPGFKSSPTVTEKVIYLGDEEGTFHAIDRATGKKLWTFATEGEIFSSATIYKDKVLFGSYDNHLYCLNIKDGSLAWKFGTDGYVHCGPAIADHYTFIAGCDEHLRMIDIDTGKQAGDLPLATYLIASPAIVGDKLYVGTYGSEIVGINWKDLKVVWRYHPTDREFPFQSSAAVTDELVVAGARDKQVHAVERATGKAVWTHQTRARVDSSPAVAGSRVYIGSSDGNVYGLDLKTGKELWKFNMGKAVTAGPAIGEHVLVIGCESSSGRVCCFGAK